MSAFVLENVRGVSPAGVKPQASQAPCSSATMRISQASQTSLLAGAAAAVAGWVGRRNVMDAKGIRPTRPVRAVTAVARRATTELDESGPWSFVKLVNGDSEATVYLRGAHVTSFKVAGVEWIGMRADCKLDGTKQNISGGIPICFPQFGPGEVIVQHGFARNMDWKFLADESSDGVCVLELTETEETMKVWPHEFRCKFKVELKNGELNTSLKVENLSKSDSEFSCGLHSYWNVSDIDALIVKGDFNGCMKTDRTADPPTPFEYKQDEITITSFADEMYAKVLPGTVVLEDPGKGELQIKSGGGWKDVVVWNPYGDDKVGYKTFVCVESVETETVSLAAGKAWEATMDLVPSK